MANHAEPTLTNTYVEVLSKLDARFDDQAKMFDPATVDTTVTNIPSGTIQWDSASNSWKKYNGTSWVALSTSYAINISGNADTVDNKNFQPSNFSVNGILYASDTNVASCTSGPAFGSTTSIMQITYGSAPGWVDKSSVTVGGSDTVRISTPDAFNSGEFLVHFGSFNPLSLNPYEIVYVSTKLTFNSTSGDLTATGNVTAYSDIKLKTDLVKISEALSKVKQLTGYTYTRLDTGVRQTGLIAQDVEKVLPEAVKQGEHLALAYGNMLGLIVEAIKELDSKLEEIKSKLN